MKKLIVTTVLLTTGLASFAHAQMSMMMETNLWMGSRGSAVISLQTALEEKGYLVMPAGTAKGYFGAATKRALQAFQRSEGVSATGYFGPMTRAALGGKMMMKNSMNDNMQKGVMVGGALMVPNLDIVDNAVNANNVTTVVAAVKAAGLVDTLKSAGPFTVFAPTNSAFEKLPAGTVATLLQADKKADLTGILTYHVVAGAYTSDKLTDGLVLKTVNGKTLKFTHDAQGGIWINGSAKVETKNVISKNGVTHVIDTVLMPTAAQYMEVGVEVGGALMVSNLDIVDNAMKANNVTTVVAAVKAAGLVDTLKGPGPFTVFAPNNAAFEKLPAGTVTSLLAPEKKGDLTNILVYHVVAGAYTTDKITDGMTLTTVQGQKLTFKKGADGNLWINGKAMIKTPNVISKNGVTHVIDTVLIPN